jgi:hypothetical protein
MRHSREAWTATSEIACGDYKGIEITIAAIMYFYYSTSFSFTKILAKQ